MKFTYIGSSDTDAGFGGNNEYGNFNGRYSADDIKNWVENVIKKY